MPRRRKPQREFQSTLPVWGATDRITYLGMKYVISIHAPRVGSDPDGEGFLLGKIYFNPRSPCGERLHRAGDTGAYLAISIHAPRVGSDNQMLAVAGRAECISIHAPRVGSDQGQTFPVCGRLVFQSTLPVWGATPAARWYAWW